MAIRTDDARYEYGLPFAMLIASNYDKTIPTPDRVVGGVGGFDFSGALVPGAVPLSIRIDTETVMTVNLNVTAGAADISNVTVAEMVIMINAAGFTDITATEEAVTGYLHIAYTGTGNPTFMQVYGEAARLCGIGQGKGCKFVKADTVKTFENSPEINASESIETEAADGKKTTIKTDSSRKGFTGTITDTASDYLMREIIEGGTLNTTTNEYDAPTQDSQKIYFVLYVFTVRYAQGDNFEGDLTDYVWKKFKKCMGDMGAKSSGKAWADNVFPIMGVSYKDETGVISGDTSEQVLSIAEYEALDVENL